MNSAELKIGMVCRWIGGLSGGCERKVYSAEDQGQISEDVGAELHRLASLRATNEGIKLNQVVVQALQAHLQPAALVARGRRATDNNSVFVSRVATAAAQPLQYELGEILNVSATAH